ncbi:SUKH-4 family immunity protein [Hymenobacter psoromatis]|uniref:SUKH-4 family immunity protein n=1 Tax=Hymenobacter psoromatis TaxID=1484116 RepID=UPI001CBAB8AF|nr:SUKH-4 family immunity protein [Hymenobacter psoromatis]
MLLKDFCNVWGDGLLPLASSVLQAVPISEVSKQFFRDVCLPKEAKPNLIFYAPPDVLAPMPAMLPEISFPLGFRRYLVLADDGGTFLCIDIEDDEHVIAVDAYQELMTRFVNSTVTKFAEFLLAYRGLPEPEQAKKATRKMMKEQLDSLKEQFHKIDPEALRNPDNWWSVIIEELELFT